MGWSLRCRGLVVALLIGGTLPACSNQGPVETLPGPRATLAAAGKRLIGTHSPEALTTLATRGDRVLAVLTGRERDALARGALRFRVDRPSVVAVAASRRATPFWLDDLGFATTGQAIEVDGEEWPLYRRSFPKGWVGLGVNGLDRTAPAHYVVFVAPERGEGPVGIGLDDDGWRVVPAREGIGAASGVALPIGALPQALRGSLLLQPSHDRRHSALLARGKVWKTHVVSGDRPDQVVVSFGSDPARSLVWTWRTAPEVAATALRIARDSDRTEARIVRGTSRLVELPDLLNDPTIRRHSASATDLEPDTSYAYAVGDGTPGGWSPWRTVRTGPARPRDVHFLYLGDAQCGLEGWGKLLHQARARHPEAEFLLLAGDLVDRGNERTNWDHFFLRAAGVFESIPLMPCAGNHEYLDRGPKLYRANFDLPANGPAGIDPGLVYSFEYGGAFVAVLDSTLAVADPECARLQADWLDAALSKTRAAWTFVMFHHPVYASHPTREYPALAAAWVPVFDKHHVDLVLQGHDHAYLRTDPLRDGHRAASNGEGTTYIVSVSGEKFVDQAPRPYTAVGFTNTSTYQTIALDSAGTRLDYRAWRADGREVDRLVIEKPRRLAGMGGG